MKKFNTIFNLSLMALLAIGLTMTSCKKDNPVEDNPDNNPTTKKKMLVIENGAQNIAPDGSVKYKAHVVDEDGQVSAAKNAVTWSVSESTMATISSGGIISTLGVTGSMTVTATATVDGTELTATTPLGIYIQPSLFAVAPSAIIGFKGDTYELIEALIALSTDLPTFTYASSNTSVATVSASGLVTLTGGGDCIITVTASTMANTPFNIPVAVIAEPVIPLPITKVELSPASAEKFRGETAQFSAKAFNTAGEVAGAQFEWTTSDSNIATVDASGLVTTIAVGEATVYAKSSGILGQAEIIVKPDTAILVEPFFAEVGAGKTKQFTAKAYNLRTQSLISDITTFDWQIPTYGFSIFDIASVDANGLVTVKSNATVGMISTVIATVPGKPELGGAASVMVKLADIGGCNCGSNVANVASISVPSTLTMSSFGGTATLNPVALDASGNEVSGVTFNYCVDSSTIVSMFENTVNALGFAGTATITVCVGDVSATVAVTTN